MTMGSRTTGRTTSLKEDETRNFIEYLYDVRRKATTSLLRTVMPGPRSLKTEYVLLFACKRDTRHNLRTRATSSCVHDLVERTAFCLKFHVLSSPDVS